MLDQLEKKIRHIQVFSSKTANELLSGEYHSVFKGHGLEFSELHEYQYGDDPRSINWQITARVGKPFVKRYIEERELTLFLLVDLSSSATFGSQGKTKQETIVELCSLLAFSAINNNDKVGLIIFTDSIEKVIPPGCGKRHVLRIINELITFERHGDKTDINQVLDFFGHLHAKRSVAFLVSDFQDSSYESALSVIAKQHDLIAVSITDPAETQLPQMGLVEFYDPETQESAVIDTASKKIRDRYHNNALRRKKELSETFSRLNIDEIELSTEKDIILEIIQFFRTREKRGSHG